MKHRALALAAVVLFPAAGGAAPAAPAGLPIGLYTRLDPAALERTKAAGFDFAEVGLRDAVALSDADFAAVVDRARGLKLPLRAAINFLPTDMKVVGPEIDKARQNSYLATAFARAQRLGLATVVFGSGRSRRTPEDFSREEAFHQLAEFGRRAARVAARHHITIAIESLGPDESNTINTVPEAIALVHAVGHNNFRLAVDYYHMVMAKEDLAVVLKAGMYLRHVRIANPAGRAFPLAASESDYATFFRHLSRIGYHGPIGIEARIGDVASDGPRALAFLRAETAALAGRKR